MLARFNDLFYRLRKKHGLTQAQFAQRLGITRSRVSHVETGRVHINHLHLETYAEALGEDECPFDGPDGLHLC